MGDYFDDVDNDPIYELGTVVPKRVRDTALKLYLSIIKVREHVPAPLQDYVNRGLQRIIDGEENPYPVSKSDKNNCLSIWAHVTNLSKTMEKKDAIKEAALFWTVTTRTVIDACKKFDKEPPKYFYYYLLGDHSQREFYGSDYLTPDKEK